MSQFVALDDDAEEGSSEPTEEEFASMLHEAILAAGTEEPEEYGEWSVSTFEEVGLLTSNAGLVISRGGAEFQLTVVRSR